MKVQKVIDISPKEKTLAISLEDLAFFGHQHYQQVQSYAEIEGEFDRWAFGSPATRGFTYDDLAHFFGYNAPEKLADLVLPFLGRFQKPEILDVGCGTGKSGLPYLAQGHAVDGIDLSGNMITAAQQRGYRSVWKHNVIRPFPTDAQYDVAVSIGMIGEYVSASPALPHIIAALKDRAVIGIASEMQQDWTAIQRKLKGAGFTLACSKLDLGYQPIKGFQKIYTYVVATRGL